VFVQYYTNVLILILRPLAEAQTSDDYYIDPTILDLVTLCCWNRLVPLFFKCDNLKKISNENDRRNNRPRSPRWRDVSSRIMFVRHAMAIIIIIILIMIIIMLQNKYRRFGWFVDGCGLIKIFNTFKKTF
jgi:hypothetical protein